MCNTAVIKLRASHPKIYIQINSYVGFTFFYACVKLIAFNLLFIKNSYNDMLFEDFHMHVPMQDQIKKCSLGQTLLLYVKEFQEYFFLFQNNLELLI